MGELVKAVMVERASSFEMCVYTAESGYLSSASAQNGFTVQSQINLNSYFLLQKVGLQISAINGGGGTPLRVPLPSVSWGSAQLIDPLNNKQYTSAKLRNIMLPGLMNNTIDLDEYILIPGANWIALQIAVNNPYGNNAIYAGHFIGVEFVTRINVDISQIRQLALDYMPPTSTPSLPVNARSIATPAPKDIARIRLDYNKLLAYRNDIYNRSMNANNNTVIAQQQYGNAHPISTMWAKTTQALNKEVSNADDLLSQLRSMLVGANAVTHQ